jgi:hypothetical protein
MGESNLLVSTECGNEGTAILLGSGKRLVSLHRSLLVY